MKRPLFAALALTVLLASGTASAHKPSDSYLSILLKNSKCSVSASTWPRSDLVERPLLNATNSGDHPRPPKGTLQTHA